MKDDFFVAGVFIGLVIIIVGLALVNLSQSPLGVDSYYYLEKLQHFLGWRYPPLPVFNLLHVFGISALLTLEVIFALAILYCTDPNGVTKGRAILAAALVILITLASGTGTMRYTVFEFDDFVGIGIILLALILGVLACCGENARRSAFLIMFSTLVTIIGYFFVWAGIAVVVSLTVITVYAVFTLETLPIEFRDEFWDRAYTLILLLWFVSIFIYAFRTIILSHVAPVSEQSAIAYLGALLIAYALPFVSDGLLILPYLAAAFVYFGTWVPKFAQLTTAVAAPIIAAIVAAATTNTQLRQEKKSFIIFTYVFIGLSLLTTIVGLVSFSEWQNNALATVGYGVMLSQDLNLPLVNYWCYGYWVKYYGGNTRWLPSDWNTTYPHDEHAVYILPKKLAKEYCSNTDNYTMVCSPSFCSVTRKEVGSVLGSLVICPPEDFTSVSAFVCEGGSAKEKDQS